MSHRKFRYLPHTADMAFEAYGRDLKSLVENAALALLNVMLDVKKIKIDKGEVRSTEIRESAKTIDDLVWFTLQDILSKREMGSLDAFKFKVESLKEGKNTIKLAGALFHKQVKRDYSLLDVKAVTPHDLNVKKTKSGYAVKIVIDV